jgi:hypothetical protein
MEEMDLKRRLSNLVAIRAETLKALGARDGTVWTKSSGELHYQYKEMPNWIQLAKAKDLQTAHAEFLKIVLPYFDQLGEVNLTVSYSDGKTQLAFFNTNEEIRMAFTSSLAAKTYRSGQSAKLNT